MEVLIIGAGIGGLTLGPDAASRRHRLPHFRGGARTQGCRRRHQHPAACVARAVRARARGCACESCGHHARILLLQSLRPVHLQRTGGQIRRLRCAAVFYPSRRLADGPARCVRRARGRGQGITGWRCTRVEHDGPEAIAYFEDANGKPLPPQRGSVVISAEGIHSVLRKQLYPNEGPPKYSGINMWRGVTRWKPFLSGASMIRIGWHHPAKLLIYPIRNNVDAEGRQLVNWVCDIETPQYKQRDWNRRGKLEDFLPAMADWHFDWLDVPAIHQRSRRDSGISDGRSGSAAALELRPPDAAGRCGASDVSARRQWCGAGHSRLRAR